MPFMIKCCILLWFWMTCIRQEIQIRKNIENYKKRYLFASYYLGAAATMRTLNNRKMQTTGKTWREFFQFVLNFHNMYLSQLTYKYLYRVDDVFCINLNLLSYQF